MLDLSDLSLEAAQRDDAIVLQMAGELDVATAGQFLGVLDNLIHSGVTTVRLDGSGLTFVDSAGLRAIVVGRSWAEQASVEYGVVAASDAFDRVLSITGLAEALCR